MRPVNLIPPEDRRGDHAPLRAGVASYAIVGVLAVALIGVVMVVLTGNDINESKSELAGLEARKAQADVAAAELAPYGEFATLEQSRSETVSSLAQSRFDWERVLNELALVVPRRVTLESLTGAAGSGVTVGGETGGTTTAADASIAGPSLQIGGCANGQKGVARLLAALRDIDGVTRVGMQSSELGEEQTTTGGATSSDEQAGAEAGPVDCQTGPSVARFQASVAFDAVPVPETAAPPAGTAPATATAPEATETTTTETTTEDPGIAAAQVQGEAAIDSANEQVAESKDGAAAAGVGE